MLIVLARYSASTADVFDALSMKRPYKEPWEIEKIMEHIHASSGQHFDPTLFDVFTSILPRILELKAKWELGAFANGQAHGQSGH